MTNTKTTLGAALWMAVSGLMLLAALEPISVQTKPVELAARTVAQNEA
jgi:hypothetical protein